MNKNITLLDGDLTLYARWFYYSLLTENDKRVTDGISFSIFAYRHNNSIKDFLPSLKKVAADEEINRLIECIKEKLSISLDILNLYMVCAYINEVIREQFVVLLKKPTKEALDELGEIEEISFKDKEGKTVTTNYVELLKVCIESAKEFLKLKGDVIETAKMGRYDKIGSPVDKSIIQSQFAYYIARFLADAFPEANRDHRGRKSIVSPQEQELVLRLMGYFDLALKYNSISTDNFRRLMSIYNKLRYPFKSYTLLLKHDDWNGKIDWVAPNLKLKELTSEDENRIMYNSSTLV